MTQYVGLDVSLNEVSICVVDADGSVVAEGKVATEPARILSWIRDEAGAVEQIVHESGPLSIWLTRDLAALGAPVVCIDARAAHKALSARMNKSDRIDAQALAQLARTGWYRAVHIKSEASDRLRFLLGVRDRMIRIRRDIEGQARGVLKTYGIRLGSVTQGQNRAGFRDQLQAAASGDPILEVVATSLIAMHDVACAEAAAIEEELLAIARDSDLARRLMTVPGVGPIVALNFIAAIDDVGRFAKAIDVGAYLGLTPRRYQSGEIDYSGRISKRGDGAMRALLYEAANVLIIRVRRFSPLKAWAMRLAARKGLKKAAVAPRARPPSCCCACGVTEPLSPGLRGGCQHDQVGAPGSVLPERNVVPPGRRRDNLAPNVEAGPLGLRTSQATFGDIQPPTPSWGGP